MSKKVHVKTGDTVMVINGKDRGKTGKVMQVSPSEGKVIVEKVNLVTKHVKPRQMGEPGGLITAESALCALTASSRARASRSGSVSGFSTNSAATLCATSSVPAEPKRT